MATTRLYLDMRGKAKDGKGTILITLFHNHTTATITTGIRIHPDEWKNERIVKIPGADAMNVCILQKKTDIDRAIAVLAIQDRFENMTATEIKSEISGGKPKCIRGHCVSDLFNEYMSNGMKPGTAEIYKATLKKVLSYGGEHMRIEGINLRWLIGFDQYLSKTQCINGRSIYLRSLKAVCNYSYKIKLIPSNPFDDFKVKSEPTIKRNISVELLREFRDCPTSPDKCRYRDYFFLMFYLIGINTKDILLAKKSQVVNGRLEYIREKTGKKYSIKIEPEAQALIDKYYGKGEYLLEAMDHCKLYRSFSHEINDAIKLIGYEEEEVVYSDNLFAEPVVNKKIAPVIPNITTYFSRHTWATLAYEIGISLDTISQALGHSSGNRTTLIYVKFDQQKVDEANRKVIDYFLSTSALSR